MVSLKPAGLHSKTLSQNKTTNNKNHIKIPQILHISEEHQILNTLM
jgi:hypothetical protein